MASRATARQDIGVRCHPADRGRKRIPEALGGSQQQVFGGRRGSDFPGVEQREDAIQLVKLLILSWRIRHKGWFGGIRSSMQTVEIGALLRSC
jgi:hypothetical protein